MCQKQPRRGVVCHTCLMGPLMYTVGCPRCEMSCPTCVLVC